MNRALHFSTNNKRLSFIILGHISMALLFVFAVIFFKERVLFSDSAFQFFKIINFEKINIEAARYGAILPEIPILIAIKTGCSLRCLTVLYSTSFILLYYFIFISCVHFLKNIVAGLSVVLVLTLSISQSFFHPVTETHQSLVFSVLLYAILQYSEYRYKIIQYLLAIIVIVISFLAHPVALYANTFIIGYTAINNRQLKSVKPYLLLIIVGGIAITKVLLTNENSYEGKFFTELLNSPSMILNLLNANSVKFFIQGLLNGLYLLGVIMELFLIVYFIFQKKYSLLIWQIASLIVFLLITFLTYNKGDATVLMERAFMPLALFVSIPLIKELINNKRWHSMYKIAFLSIVITISLTRIYRQGIRFKARTTFNKELLTKTAQFQNHKFIIENNQLQKHVITFWSNSFESLILSTITEDIPTQTIYPANNIDKLTKYTEKAKDVFLGTDWWLEWGIKDLNKKYFNLPSDISYKVVNLDDLLTNSSL